MLSHDLARLLLARRNNDVKFEVGSNLDADSPVDVTNWHIVEMMDDRERVISGKEIPPEQVVLFNSEHDYLLIRLGIVYP